MVNINEMKNLHEILTNLGQGKISSDHAEYKIRELLIAYEMGKRVYGIAKTHNGIRLKIF
jgi:hypothetical protein